MSRDLDNAIHLIETLIEKGENRANGEEEISKKVVEENFPELEEAGGFLLKRLEQDLWSKSHT